MPEFTGERVVPGLVDVNLLNEHRARYAFAQRFAAGRRVLDAGCGSGYGAAALARSAAEVTGIDAAGDAIQYAREHFGAANVRFEQGLCNALPDGPFDLITAFEVIEHLEDWRGLLEEARRVLAPGGRFLVSTPNKLYYAESRREAGANPFHVHEFEFGEFREELERVFGHVVMLAQNHVEGVAFATLEPTATVEAAMGERGAIPEDAHFFVAVCAAEPLPELGSFVWVPAAANVLRERERHIHLLEEEVQLRTGWMEQSRAELALRNREYEDLLAMVRRLNTQVEEGNQWALKCQAESEARARRVFDLQEELVREQEESAAIIAAYEEKVTGLEETNAAKTRWAVETEERLSAEVARFKRELASAVDLLHDSEKTVAERTAWAQGLDRELADWQARFGHLHGSHWVRLGLRLKLVDRS